MILGLRQERRSFEWAFLTLTLVAFIALRATIALGVTSAIAPEKSVVLCSGTTLITLDGAAGSSAGSSAVSVDLCPYAAALAQAPSLPDADISPPTRRSFRLSPSRIEAGDPVQVALGYRGRAPPIAG